MAKFARSDDEPTPPVERELPAPPPPPPAPPPVTVIDVNNQNNSAMAQQTVQMQMQTAQVQAQSQVGVAEVSLDREIMENQLEKQDEHWMKAYWRPGMGWLYMLICLMDFVVFPAVSMFVPIITKMPYIAWQSLTLSNGGLIHMAFGAILGVAAYGRTQEKVASKQ